MEEEPLQCRARDLALSLNARPRVGLTFAKGCSFLHGRPLRYVEWSSDFDHCGRWHIFDRIENPVTVHAMDWLCLLHGTHVPQSHIPATVE